jgi:hypothetical protein
VNIVFVVLVPYKISVINDYFSSDSILFSTILSTIELMYIEIRPQIYGESTCGKC